MNHINKKKLMILTLERHCDGIWITRLVDSLSLLLLREENRSLPFCKVQVVTLESLLQNPFCPPALFENWIGVVNRVSDAAPPVLYKACLAVLHAAVACNIKVWNGPNAYATCGNKWCHHVLFQQARLSSPETHAVLLGSNSYPEELSFPQLIKPNAGGFGAGMVRVENKQELMEQLDRVNYEDGMALFQSYVSPRNRENYRVWFLLGKVQCGVARRIGEAQNEFTSACASGVCTRKQQQGLAPQFSSWSVPPGVVKEIEKQLLPLLPDAHSGSVEFLHDKDGQRLYFDLNLLSTLPTNNIDNTAERWPPEYDPWKELASAIVTLFS